MIKQGAIVLLGVLFFTSGCNGQDVPEPSASRTEAIPEPDSSTLRLFSETMAFARAQDLKQRPIGEIMTELGERFVGKPYAAGLLDEPASEMLVCTLNEFDCVTFVESVLAMGRAIKRDAYDYETWAGYMLDQRYRGGRLEGYCSRLHYFSDWILDNERRGTVRNITEEIGGVPFDKDLRFMTAHRESYPRFAENDSLYGCILEMERRLRDADLFYVPQDRIAETYDRLQAGDIIATATHIEGLDVTHTGLVYDAGDGARGLLHASTSGGVKVSPDLQAYVQGVDAQIGIIVARPLEPAN
jgi:cell wall-associated NlpC family hydrolase